MSTFVEQALQSLSRSAESRTDLAANPDWLKPIRERGQQVWSQSQMPNRKTEDWRYTSLRKLEVGDYLGQPEFSDDSLIESRFNELNIPSLTGPRVVFYNGRFVESLSDLDLETGLEIVPFSAANSEQSAQIAASLGSVIDQDKYRFAALNDSWLHEGLFVSVADNVEIERSVHLIWLSDGQDYNFSLNSRLFVSAGVQSRLQIVEQFASLNQGDVNGNQDDGNGSFTNNVSEFSVGEGASLTHHRLHLEQALHIGGVHARLDRNSTFNSFQLATGSALKRLDVDVELAGEGAHCELSGVYLPCNDQLIDFHTRLRHMVPNCTSNEVYRGIVADKSRAVFNGLIYIHPQAQKTNAQLSNKNLLTSDQAEVDTKPELQIYANDVQCAHGATVAQLDEQLLYYMQSRGIDRQEAEVLLSFGFINELLGRLNNEAISDFLRPVLANLFSRDPDLARHIQ